MPQPARSLHPSTFPNVEGIAGRVPAAGAIKQYRYRALPPWGERITEALRRTAEEVRGTAAEGKRTLKQLRTALSEGRRTAKKLRRTIAKGNENPKKIRRTVAKGRRTLKEPRAGQVQREFFSS